MKHAYLTLVHNQFELTRCSLSCLDDSRNELGFHFDRLGYDLSELNMGQAHRFPSEETEGRMPFRGFCFGLVVQGGSGCQTVDAGRSWGAGFLGSTPQYT